MIYTKKVCGLQKNSAQEGKGGNKQMKKEKTTIDFLEIFAIMKMKF